MFGFFAHIICLSFALFEVLPDCCSHCCTHSGFISRWVCSTNVGYPRCCLKTKLLPPRPRRRLGGRSLDFKQQRGYHGHFGKNVDSGVASSCPVGSPWVASNLENRCLNLTEFCQNHRIAVIKDRSKSTCRFLATIFSEPTRTPLSPLDS